INALTAGASDNFSFSVSDGGLSSTTAFAVTLTGANDTPTLNAVSRPTYTDTANNDTFVATTGTLTGADRDTGASLSYGVTGRPTGGSTTLGGITYDVSKVAIYGTLYGKPSTALFPYATLFRSINALSAGATDNFSFSVSDGGLSSTTAFTVTLVGVNDAP